MIKTFADKHAEQLFRRRRLHKRLPGDLQRKARQKLAMLHRARQIEDLRVPPGNRLEALKGDRRGQHSIRINDQFRVCFIWHKGDAHDVEIVDYH